MKLAVLLLIPAVMAAQTAEEIMARVAENQSRAEDARASFVYHENLLVRMKRANGKLAREEIRDYTVTPTPTGVKREMVHFAGKYGLHGKEYDFATPGYEYKGMDIDAGVAKDLADHFGRSRQSKDGIGRDLFPLTQRGQEGYAFHLESRQKYKDRDVFRITFKPAEKDGRRIWAGEALIDAAEYQPVLVTTHFARGIPAAVKIIAGTNISQMGFKISYQKLDDRLWFPASYSGELRVRFLFVYARSISIGAINSDFKKTDVRTEIAFQ
ncbi:MAG: hypothetical protein JWO80_5539 [Bryobacterales bacterium]|nr:hypothetical protein [Bryobacterales bacterium]